jgi:hypothetical protein
MDLASILAATGNFSKANKLGEGGFGPVYRVRDRPIQLRPSSNCDDFLA